MPRLLIWAVPLLIGAAPALAEETKPAEAAKTTAAPAQPRKVCRTEQITGRRISQTRCYTAAQWAELDRTGNEKASRLIMDVIGGAATARFPGSDSGATDTRSLFGLGNPQ